MLSFGRSQEGPYRLLSFPGSPKDPGRHLNLGQTNLSGRWSGKGKKQAMKKNKVKELEDQC